MQSWFLPFFPAKPIIHRALSIAVELIKAISDEVVKTREICFNTFQRSLELALDLFPLYLEHPGIENRF